MQEATLENGMRVIIVPDHRSPVVLHSVWFQAGSVDEAEGVTGIAHMLEHMMFKSTKNRTNEEREKLIQRNGAQENAFTSRDYTAYYQKVAKDRLGLMMDQEADRMVNLALTDEVFQPERKVVLEERQLRTESNPVNRFYEKLVSKHFGKHPYEHPVIGWREDIEGYKLQDNLDWYNTHYAPNNATMILVGDITLDEALPMVKKHYGDLKPAETPKRKLPEQPLREEEVRFVEVDKDVQVPLFVQFYRAPSAQAKVAGIHGDTADAPALEVLADILGGGQTSRLYKALVTEQKIADSASSGYDETGAGESSIDVYAQPKPDVTLDRIEKAVDDVIAELLKKGVTEDEVSRSIMALKSSHVYGQDDLFNTVYRLGLWLMAGGDTKGYNAYIGKVESVTKGDVLRVAKKYFVKQHRTTGLLVAEESQLK